MFERSPASSRLQDRRTSWASLGSRRAMNDALTGQKLVEQECPHRRVCWRRANGRASRPDRAASPRRSYPGGVPAASQPRRRPADPRSPSGMAGGGPRTPRPDPAAPTAAPDRPGGSSGRPQPGPAPGDQPSSRSAAAPASTPPTGPAWLTVSGTNGRPYPVWPTVIEGAAPTAAARSATRSTARRTVPEQRRLVPPPCGPNRRRPSIIAPRGGLAVTPATAVMDGQPASRSCTEPPVKLAVSVRRKSHNRIRRHVTAPTHASLSSSSRAPWSATPVLASAQDAAQADREPRSGQGRAGCGVQEQEPRRRSRASARQGPRGLFQRLRRSPPEEQLRQKPRRGERRPRQGAFRGDTPVTRPVTRQRSPRTVRKRGRCSPRLTARATAGAGKR